MTEKKPIRIVQTVTASRIETGSVQFGDDWPGVFIRGDDCLGLALALSVVLDQVRCCQNASRYDVELAADNLRRVQQMLLSCQQSHNPGAEIP